MNERGYSLIPLRLYFRDGKVKLLLALAKGKKKYDKRESIRQREEKRDLDRQRKEYK
jgi:SsrA-binding protein